MSWQDACPYGSCPFGNDGCGDGAVCAECACTCLAEFGANPPDEACEVHGPDEVPS